MTRVTTILFLIYYTIGTIFFPLGDLSFVTDLPKMYQTCSVEDPDINVADFIFEHLLNLHDSEECETDEKPHQAFFSHQPLQVLFSFAARINFTATNNKEFLNSKVYTTIPYHADTVDYVNFLLKPPQQTIA